MPSENGWVVSERTEEKRGVKEPEMEKPLSRWKKMRVTYFFVGITTFYFTVVTFVLIVYPLLKALGAK